MANIIIILVIAALLFFAVRKIVKLKKSGSACIGCSCAGSCPKKGGKCDCEKQ